jgi:hypothetical protein
MTTTGWQHDKPNSETRTWSQQSERTNLYHFITQYTYLLCREVHEIRTCTTETTLISMSCTTCSHVRMLLSTHALTLQVCMPNTHLCHRSANTTSTDSRLTLGSRLDTECYTAGSWLAWQRPIGRHNGEMARQVRQRYDTSRVSFEFPLHIALP